MERKKCEECGGKVVKKKVDFSLYGTSLGKFDAEVCMKCGEKVFDEKISDKIDEIAKKKGLWGLDIKTKITQAGNSLAIRIPKKIVDFLKLKKEEQVFMHPQDHKLVIEATK